MAKIDITVEELKLLNGLVNQSLEQAEEDLTDGELIEKDASLSALKKLLELAKSMSRGDRSKEAIADMEEKFNRAVQAERKAYREWRNGLKPTLLSLKAKFAILELENEK